MAALALKRRFNIKRLIGLIIVLLVGCSSFQKKSEYSSIVLPKKGFGILHIYRELDPATKQLSGLAINEKPVQNSGDWLYKCLYLKNGYHSISIDTGQFPNNVVIKAGKESYYKISYAKGRFNLGPSDVLLGSGLVTEKTGMLEQGAKCTYF